MTAQTTVTIAAVYVDGTPLANHRVKVQLIHGGAGGTVDGNLIADRSTVRLDAAGEGSIDLYPNAAISPANTYYSFTVDNSSPTIVRLVSVPASGPVSWTDAGVLLEDPSPPTVVPAPDSGVAGQVLGVVDPGDGPRYDLIDQTGGGTTDASELTTGTLPFARLPIGTTSTTVPAGNDTRLSDARTPTAHKTSHATGGGDALAPSDIGAVPMSRTLAGLDLSADRTASALRTALGLVIGTDVLAPNGSGASLTGIPESAVTNLVTDLAAKAPLASPTFTGTPAAPTAAAGTATTQVATTAFVGAAAPARPRVVGAYANGAISTRTGTFHDATALGRLLVFPTWLWAGSIDRIYVRTGVAAVSTWRIGIYPLDATTLKPDGQTKLSGTDSSINMNATAGTLEATITATIPSSGLWGMAVLVDAYTATPNVHSVSSDGSTNLGLARPWSVTGQSVSGAPHFDGIAFMATGVTTGVSALPTTCPTTAPNAQTPVVGVRYA